MIFICQLTQDYCVIVHCYWSRQVLGSTTTMIHTSVTNRTRPVLESRIQRSNHPGVYQNLQIIIVLKQCRFGSSCQ